MASLLSCCVDLTHSTLRAPLLGGDFTPKAYPLPSTLLTDEYPISANCLIARAEGCFGQ